MSLRQLAEQDLQTTLEDTVGGFGWPLTLTDPLGVSVNLSGQSHDISQLVDPDTGTVVSGKEVAVVLRLSSITLAGLAEPEGEARSDRKPWLCTFDDINGAAYTFKVENADPDRTLGTITLKLGAWTDA